MGNKLTRRAALSGIAALVPAAATAVPAVDAIAHPDAELLALDKQIDALLARFAEHEALPDDVEHPAWDPIYEAIDAAPDDDPDSNFWNDPEAWHRNKIQAEWFDSFKRIMDAKPATKDGLAVMARVYLLRQDMLSHDPDADGYGERLAQAILSVFGIAAPPNEFSDRFEERIRHKAA